MFVAALLSAFALTGVQDGRTGGVAPAWVSAATPIPGTEYRAMSWSGGRLDCTGVIAGEIVPSSVRYESKTGVCVVSIPQRAAGKTLRIMYGVTTGVGDQETVTHGSLSPRLIGSTPVPRAGRPFLVVLHPADAELLCDGGGSIDGKRVPIRYEHAEGTVACLLLIPKGTAGRRLLWSCTHSVTSRPEFERYGPDGNAIYRQSILVADCFGHYDLIRPAVVRRPASVSAMPPLYKNCTALNRRYPHGVGRASARDKTAASRSRRSSAARRSTTRRSPTTRGSTATRTGSPARKPDLAVRTSVRDRRRARR